MLDYILLNVVHPKNCPTICLPIANYTSAPTLTHAPVHQYLAHIEEDKLDTMCRKQSMIGLPKWPYHHEPFSCPVCTSCKFAHPAKGHTIDTSTFDKGALLHIDFSFWDVIPHWGFASMLTIVDARARMLWIFCTPNKWPPLDILLFHASQGEDKCTWYLSWWRWSSHMFHRFHRISQDRSQGNSWNDWWLHIS